jgi:hypothetical protein
MTMTAGMLDLTDGAPRRPRHRPPTPPDVTEGGFQAVANLLNRVFDWDATGNHKPVYRQQVAAWHAHGTLNRLGQLPPSPVTKRLTAARTTPFWIFDTTDASPWVDWAAAGVPGTDGKGWAVPVRREGS